MTEDIRHIPLDRGVTNIALMRGDEELSRALVVPMTMHFGRVELRMDGIGGVATPEAHRHKGYSRRVLEAAIRFMTVGDAVISTLYGIPDFYPKYGFRSLGPEPVITPVHLHERNVLNDGYVERYGAQGDLQAIKRLYWDETDGTYGSLVREEGWWTWGILEAGLGPDRQEIKVVERHGVVVGYAYRASRCWWMDQWRREDPDGLKIGEAFAIDANAADAVLASCRRWAVELETPKLQLAIPKRGRVGAAGQFQNVLVVDRYYDQAQFMGRSIGLVALMRGLAPELEARWHRVGGSMQGFSVTLSTEREHVTISGDDEGIRVRAGRSGGVDVQLTAGAVAQLALGGFEPADFLDRLDVPLSARLILATLFPKHVPYIYPLDRF